MRKNAVFNFCLHLIFNRLLKYFYGKERFEAGIGFHYFEEICRVPRPSKKEEKSEIIWWTLQKPMRWNIKWMRLEMS